MCDVVVGGQETDLGGRINTLQAIHNTTTTIVLLRSLYRSTCVSRHLQLTTDFAGARFYCPHALADGNHAAHSDYAGVLLNSVIYTASIYRLYSLFGVIKSGDDK